MRSVGVIHKMFPEFLQPLPDFRTCATRVGKQRVSPFYRGFLFICFWILVGLGAHTRIGSKQRVSPFYHLFNMCTWHRHWRGITFSSILSFSSLIITWCCCRWRRRAWRRCRTMPLLSWRCHWGWMIKTGWRTRWLAWNHDRNEVFRITLYAKTVF